MVVIIYLVDYKVKCFYILLIYKVFYNYLFLIFYIILNKRFFELYEKGKNFNIDIKF